MDKKYICLVCGVEFYTWMQMRSHYGYAHHRMFMHESGDTEAYWADHLIPVDAGMRERIGIRMKNIKTICDVYRENLYNNRTRNEIVDDFGEIWTTCRNIELEELQ